MPKTINIPTKFYDYGDRITTKYFTYLQNYYLTAAWDLEDFLQEVKLSIYLTGKKFGLKNLTFPLIHQRVLWTLNTITRDIRREFGIEPNSHKKIKCSCKKTERKYCPKCNGKGETLPRIYEFCPLIENLTPINTIPKIFKITDLETLLSKKDYQLVKLYFIEYKTFEEIGKTMKCTRQYVSKKYGQILKYLAKYFDKYSVDIYRLFDYII